MRTFLRGKVTLLFLTIAVLLAIPSIALADLVGNNLDTDTLDNQREIVSLESHGRSATVEMYILPSTGGTGSNADPDADCNFDSVTQTLKLKVVNDNNSSAVSSVIWDETNATQTTSPKDTIEFTGCDNPSTTDVKENAQTVKVTSGNITQASTANIAFEIVSNTTGGNFELQTGRFAVDVTPDVTAPTVQGTPTGSGQPVDTNVTASFNEAMNASTIADASGASTTFTLKKTSDSSAVAASVSYNAADNKATLNPTNDLAYSTEYTATVTTGVQDSAGNSLASNQSWTFTTVAPPCTNPADPVFQNTTPDGDNGWFTSTPTVSATSSTSGAVVKYSNAADGTYSTTAPTLNEGETTVYAKAFSSTGTCSSAAVSHTYKVDTIDPEVNPTSVVNSVWRNTDLSQAFTASDNGSGLANTADANFTLTASAESLDANTPTVVSKTVSDLAGNSTTRSVSAKIDKTNPVISGQNVNDTTWRNTDLSQSFTASDALSGLANTADANFTLTTSGESPNATTPVTASKTVSDNATNSATRTISALVDKTAPNVQVTGVSNGGTYITGNVPTPGCDTTDGLSDVKTDATVSVTGGTGGFGNLTATCSGAEDNAGNTKPPVSVTYSVKAAFNGFLQPIDGHSVNTGKFGRTYPIKWQLRDDSGALISDSAAQLLVGTMTGGQKAVSCTSFDLTDTDALEEATTGNTALRYDATSDQFIYNYKAPTSGTCYVFAIRNADGVTTQQVDFKFTK
jgi:hypothetical protein